MQRLLVVVVTALVILLMGAGLAFGLFLATAALRNRSALSLLQRLYIASASAPLLLTIVVPPVVTLAFPAAVKQRVDAILVGLDGVILANARTIIELAATHRLPAMYASKELVDADGLISFGVNYAELYRQAAKYVDKIFKGARPGDLPVEQPTKFELCVNHRTAKALGLAIPQSILLRADRVIE